MLSESSSLMRSAESSEGVAVFVLLTRFALHCAYFHINAAAR